MSAIQGSKRGSLKHLSLLLTAVSFFFFNFFNVYLFLREREKDRVQAGEGQKERERQNPKQAPGSEPSWCGARDRDLSQATAVSNQKKNDEKYGRFEPHTEQAQLTDLKRVQH